MRLRFRPIAPLVATIALVLSCSSGSRAATIGSDRPTPTSVTTIGSMRVEAYGSGSPAMVFIPGLSCGSWVWDDAVRRYEKKHAVYVVTLAGFDGLPAMPGPPIDAADASLLQLIQSKKLDRPIVIGHSLGGFLALRFGTEHSDLVRGIVSVDGTPVFPSLAQVPPEQRAAVASGITAKLAAATPEQFAAGQRTTLATMVTDPANVERVATLAAKSDQAATAAYARDLFSADLRPQLKSLTAPTLEIAPVPTKPAAYEAPQAATQSIAERSAGYRSFYASLFAGAPSVRVVPIENSLHFVMIDQPAALFAAIDEFVAKL